MSVITSQTIILKSIQQKFNGQSLSGGIFKIDLLSKKAIISLPCLNITDEESAYLIIADKNNNLTHFKLQNSKRQEIPLSNNFFNSQPSSILIALYKNGNSIPFAFGSEKTYAFYPKDLFEYAKNIENKKDADHSQKSATADDFKQNEKTEQSLVIYNDEAIAEVNYYINQSEGEDENAKFCEQDVSSFNTNFKNCAQEKNEYTSSRYETAPCDEECKKEPEYYTSIKEKLIPLFSKYPSIDALTAIIPHSKWIKIPFGNNNHYAVGTIKESGFIKYLVYGVPGFYSSKPKGFERNSRFIPLSLFNLLGEGYWCVFQEADSGKQVHCDGSSI